MKKVLLFVSFLSSFASLAATKIQMIAGDISTEAVLTASTENPMMGSFAVDVEGDSCLGRYQMSPNPSSMTVKVEFDEMPCTMFDMSISMSMTNFSNFMSLMEVPVSLSSMLYNGEAKIKIISRD